MERYNAPITLANCQMMDLGVQACTGKYVVLTSPISPLGVGGTALPANDRGGIRDERVAVSSIYYHVSKWELGCEWQITDAVEFVSTYTWTDRTNVRAISTADRRSYEHFQGDLLRFQLQVRF